MPTPVALQFRFLVVGFLLLAAAAIAQDTATLTGTIRDNTGAVIPDASVTLKNTATTATASPTLLNEFVASYTTDHIRQINTNPSVWTRTSSFTMPGLFPDFGGKRRA
jgi:hypothetical protein